ncbi:MAG: serine hydrolase domain-containing protein [Pseudomonadota bacterium]
MNVFGKFLVFILAAGSVACSSEGPTHTASPNTTTPAPAPAQLDFSAVDAAVSSAALDDIALIIGDEMGVLHVFEKGDRRIDDVLPVASASKLVTGLTLWILIEAGDLDLSDNPQRYLPYWTADEPQSRSAVTLSQLLGFTSGFNNSPAQPGCIGDGSLLLFDCVRTIYDGGIDTAPGSGFYYGPEHQQIAASMAAEATSRDFRDLVRTRLFDVLGVSGLSGWPPNSVDNPRFSGSLRTSADDYGKVLQGLLSGSIIRELDRFLSDRTDGAALVSQPDVIVENNLDWRYGSGFWIECDAPTFSAACASNPTISSPGATGFTPWIDFEIGYWAIIAINEQRAAAFRPSVFSVSLEQSLQPLIQEALANSQ